MRRNNLLLLIAIFFLGSIQLPATTINPFPNLGEMAKATETIVLAKALRNYTYEEGQNIRFRTTLEVVEHIKGSLKPTDQFAVQNYHTKIGDMERMVWGDLELEEGKTYLLFLDQIDNKVWRASMLSYAAFQMVQKGSENLLVPFDLGREVHLHVASNQAAPEPLAVYQTDKLVSMLRNVLGSSQNWDRREVATSYDPNDFEAGFRGTPPGHCTFLSGTPYARWPDFDTDDLPVSYHEDGDAGCATTATEVANAIGTINGNYLGVDLANAGTHNFTPSCSGGEGAVDNEFTTWVATNLGGSRNLVIQFDDPCSEITDLSGCNGTLAIGGLYWFSSTHTADGMSWRNAAYGYVVVNNGTGACQCGGGSTDFEIMLVHEMGHSLNIGHIAGSGTANMNPQCCNAISTLDVQCLDFIYAPPAVPVEVVSFTGKAQQNNIALNWTSVSETQNEYYILERLDAAGNFAALGKVDGAGTSFQETVYDFVDESPRIGTNYYRLSQKDYDGTIKAVDQIAVDYYTKLELTLSPNPVSGNEVQLGINTDNAGDFEIEIFSLTGEILSQSTESVAKGSQQMNLDLTNLPKGLYILKATQNNQIRTIRFVKS